MFQTLTEIKSLITAHLAAVPAEAHQWFHELVAKIEGQEALKQQLADAQALLQSNGYTVTGPAE